MENMCGFHYSEPSSMAPPPLPETSLNFISSDLQFVGSSSSSSSDEVSSNAVFQQKELEKDVIVSLRAKVASHPLFPQLLHAYIDCHKVGAPPEMAQLLDEMTSGENSGVCQISTFFGVDPELDDFMVFTHSCENSKLLNIFPLQTLSFCS
ncbi:hypothetical protein TanjilG_28716 [Lupinus angustifolius]|uniref:KNOX1 domain-containing protein n=1 Tax=Lupinus angustifolius TaxID=3871 RepID=A0A1J7GCT9_LUPAN|nr:hypothetical protein TanjilG_28716 [Lupinus angustifolius]